MAAPRLLPALALCLLAAAGAHAKCPFATRGHQALLSDGLKAPFDPAAVEALDFEAVKADLRTLMTDSQAFWPADFDGNYGGLFVRQAWHCAGSYRNWDGRGGCEGGRQRFYPEVSWPDNTNLDKSKRLLAPIKEKYGAGLSWGDLIILAGNVALEVMGGPDTLGFCAGRIDDVDGSASLELGPTPEQRAVAPCTAGDGNCEQPLGQTTMGLIYVNPEGVLGVPEPANSVPHIRGTFGRMGMNDSETVALIGGGHAIGKTHGACPTGAGPGPDKQPDDPWPGTCGDGEDKGKGLNAFTSGFEGSWTQHPTRWSNAFFKSLLAYDWEVHVGPGGHHQWRPKAKPGANTDEPLPNIMALTTDVALLHDPEYLDLVKLFASDSGALERAFGAAWYKLVTRDMGPVTRCLGKDVPAAQPFQHPLPPPPATQPNWGAVRAAIVAALHVPNPAIAPDTGGWGQPTYAAMFATLAWQCASTFRATDYSGGCNGGRIRFKPQSEWPTNKGLDAVLQVLAPVKAVFGDSLTHADLIVLAGTVALEHAAGAAAADAGFAFCGGRSDADGDDAMHYLAPRSYSSAAIAFRDNAKVMGLSPEEAVALAGRPRSPKLAVLQGGSGAWDPTPAGFSNAFFATLLGNEWAPSKTGDEGDVLEYKATVDGKEVYITPSDLVIKSEPDLAAIAQRYADDNAAFLRAFAGAWTKVMNADRFKGPAGNVCDAPAPSAATAVV